MDETEQSEATFPMYHRVGEGNQQEDYDTPHDTEIIQRVHNLRHSNPSLYLTLCESVQNPTKRAILTAIADKTNVEYSHIESYTNVSRRTIRTHIQDLEDGNIVTKEVDAIMTVSFTSRETELLAKDVLSMFYETL